MKSSITYFLAWVGISIFLLSQVASSSSLLALSCSYSSLSSCERVKSADLRLSFEYPSTWNKFEAGPPRGTLNDFLGIISLDILNPNNGSNMKYGSEFDSGSYGGLVNPSLSISFSKLSFHNLTLKEYAKIKTEDFKVLFSDLDLHIIRNSQAQKEIDGVKYWIFKYSFSVDTQVDRYGKVLWILRGDNVYEISYIADGYAEYLANLKEVENLINSIYFIDQNYTLSGSSKTTIA